VVAPAATDVVNRLIDDLPQEARSRLLKLCEPVELEFGMIVCEADQRLKHVYFPLTCFISLVAKVADHPPLEIGLIGNEGMLGATLALCVDDARLRGIVQGSGSALRMTATQLKRELRGSPALRRVLKRHLYVLMVQLSQSAVCGRFHEIMARLARWLLLTHDRAHADHFRLTHQYLADMLGVQRSAITIAAGALQRKKLISYKRGKIFIVSRRGLESASCECYQAALDDRGRLFA
jgi:CRP-like cAMP-binding protein